jgi:hypothetical protein
VRAYACVCAFLQVAVSQQTLILRTPIAHLNSRGFCAGILSEAADQRPQRLDFSLSPLIIAAVPCSPLKARQRHERCVYSPLVCKSSIFAPRASLLPSVPPASPCSVGFSSMNLTRARRDALADN